MKIFKEKQIISLLIVFAMLFSFIPFNSFTSKVYALPDTITFLLDGAPVSGNQITFHVGNEDVIATISGADFSIQEGNLVVNYSDVDNLIFTLSDNFDISTMHVSLAGAVPQDVPVDANKVARFGGLDYSDDRPHLSIVSNGGGPNGGGQVGGVDDIYFDLTWNNTYVLVDINGKEVLGETDIFQQDYTFNDILVEEAGEKDPTKTNVIKLTTRFGDNDISEWTINGTLYTPESDNVEYYDYGWFTTVPGAERYVISATGDESIPRPKTIIWVNPDYEPENEEEAEWVKDFTISHGYAKAVEVYDKDDNLLDPDTYKGMDADEYGLQDGFGWIAVMPGSRVVFEFIPEYGYQLTGIAINEMPLDSVEDMNRFEIELPNDNNAGNLHFAATFTKTEDIVKTDSEKIKSGKITLGNELEGGSAQLTVSDVELSSDKIKGFENAAGEYTISNYLNIDLYNVFYKGKDDSEDVWATKIDELSNEATITLKLADGITADDIVIVHNIHDGDTYEIIEIESYDPETNTITFKTKSFSNYAIATKTAEGSNNPKTGDNLNTWINLMLVSIFGMYVTNRSKKRRISKH